MGLLPMPRWVKRELWQCITDLAVWHVMSGMGEWATVNWWGEAPEWPERVGEAIGIQLM